MKAGGSRELGVQEGQCSVRAGDPWGLPGLLPAGSSEPAVWDGGLDTGAGRGAGVWEGGGWMGAGVC